MQLCNLLAVLSLVASTTSAVLPSSSSNLADGKYTELISINDNDSETTSINTKLENTHPSCSATAPAPAPALARRGDYRCADCIFEEIQSNNTGRTFPDVNRYLDLIDTWHDKLYAGDTVPPQTVVLRRKAGVFVLVANLAPKGHNDKKLPKQAVDRFHGWADIVFNDHVWDTTFTGWFVVDQWFFWRDLEKNYDEKLLDSWFVEARRRVKERNRRDQGSGTDGWRAVFEEC